MPKKSDGKRKQTRTRARPNRRTGGGTPRLPKRVLKDGHSDGLKPLEPLDPCQTETVEDMVTAMGKTGFGARTVGRAADVLHAMVSDPDCFVVCTLSGAMTVAKMGLVLCEMIDRGMVQAVVSTGALMTHGLVEGTGLTHFEAPSDTDDAKLFEAGYNRVYDTVELEANLNEAEALLVKIFGEVDPAQPLSSWRICELVGQELAKEKIGRTVMGSAYDRGVPVFIPAFTDSELGLDFALENRRRRQNGRPLLTFDPFDDLERFASTIAEQEVLGIFTIGGGVPRNWAQQVAPYLDLLRYRLGLGKGFVPYKYGVRICPDPPHWGHLSGCTYAEGVSWGKFVSEEQGGQYAEVLADATIVWPLVVRAVMDRMDAEQ